MIHRSMDNRKKNKKEKKKHGHGRFHSCIDAMFPSQSQFQVNDTAAGWRAAQKGHAMIAQLMSSFSARTGGGPPWSEAAPAPDDILRFCCWYTCRSLSISSLSAS